MIATNKHSLTIDQPATGRQRGRPALYASAAERQKAYRERLKERGLREVKTIVRDVRGDSPLTSDIIDLSEVRRW